MTTRRRFVVLAVSVLVAATAVGVVAVVRDGDGGGGAQAPAKVLRSQLVRDTSPNVAPASARALAGADTAAAFDLYHRLVDSPGNVSPGNVSPGNVVFSPYSITTALTMASAGARGDTLRQMLDVLHVQDFERPDLHAAVNALDLSLTGERPASPLKDHDPLELHIANSMWGQSGFPIEPAFLDLLARDYGAPLRTLDYAHHPDAAVRTINAWVEDETHGKIRDLLRQLDPLTRLVLVNAVYFKASWQTTFEQALTHDGPFHTAAGRTVTVPMMSDELPARYATGPGWQAVDLAYDGGASMTIVVPDAGTFAAYEQAFDPAALHRIDAAMRQTKLGVTMPRFRIDQRVELKPLLRALGMRDAFSPDAADFTGINRTVPLYVSEVVHHAMIDVDEHGTEAAAATAVVVREVSAAADRVVVDRPFLYFVRDTKTGSILFMGRVTDPSA